MRRDPYPLSASVDRANGAPRESTARPAASAVLADLRRIWRASGSWLPHGWGDALVQLALFAGAYYAYRLVRGHIDGEVARAFANARAIVDLERSLGLFFEPSLQAWASAHRWLVEAASAMYVNSHFVVTTTFLIWLYIARNEAFYFVRNTFMLAMGFALLGYALFPTAPPRFLPEWGFTDTVASFFGENAQKSASALYNPFAAMPSMHVAFALMIGVPAVALVRNRALRLAWAVYPLVVTFVVIVTANHFWLDAAVGAAVAATSAVIARSALSRARPTVWAWPTANARTTA
ncbi:hypothetical protein HRbin41_00045 [bacterium HR41]|nr:hypothetical protein HRbin41_00045 [bacterium HR41]